jgi:RHS repeat-associated protein
MLKSTEQSNAPREITLLRRVRAEAGYSTLVMHGQSNQTTFIWRLETAKPICLSSIDARAITANCFGRHRNLKALEQARERAYEATKLTRFGLYDSQRLWEGYSQFGNRFLFTGREWSELGSRDIDGQAERPRERARASQWLSDLHLYDYRNRMYQPELGRFLQPDPKEFGAGDFNLYRYCHNDPVNKSDPFGLVPPGEGLKDVPRDTLEDMYKASQENVKRSQDPRNTDTVNGRKEKQEHRTDGYREDGKLKRSGPIKGHREGSARQPVSPDPGNPYGPNAKREYITHSHVTGSGDHYDRDVPSANRAGVLSGVGTILDNGARMQLYVPSESGGRGGFFYTNDGIHLFDLRGNPVPH